MGLIAPPPPPWFKRISILPHREGQVEKTTELRYFRSKGHPYARGCLKTTYLATPWPSYNN